MQSTIRRLVDAAVETVVAFSLAAWALVFASLEAELGPEIYGLLFPDWRSARAGEIHMIAVDPAPQGAGLGAALVQRAVTQIKAQGMDLAAIATGGDPGHAPARALYETLDFKPFHHVRYQHH